VVGILSGTPGKEIIIAGGVLRQSDGAVVGDDTVEFIRRFKADVAVIGASALDEDGAVMDYDLREVAVARSIIANARQTILVCDRLKFDRTAPVRICSVADVHAFVTDAAPPRAFAEVCERAGVAIEIARPEE
jgi:DeoR family glycerol-3-phosphate regulon repressor